jgi:oxepin-CoA hydrolase/3-oxo-5,6-dehydrosuberyl-CoA semialdehyde dehydrogenase
MDEAAAGGTRSFPGAWPMATCSCPLRQGCFVDPDEGPVLANTGLDGLRFLKPVEPGARITVR